MQSATAGMQRCRWDDLRIVLAIDRSTGIAAAARRLGLDPTTVARRLGALERDLGTPLFTRTRQGMRLNGHGRAALRVAERLERDVDGLFRRGLGARDAIAGRVRITAAPIVASHLLAPRLASLTLSHRALEPELIAEPRNLDLLDGEADLALRFGWPTAPKRLVARRVARIVYGVFGRADIEPAALPWIGYGGGLAGYAHALWIAAASHAEGRPLATLVNDSLAAISAAEAGVGRTLLPRFVGARSSTLREIRCSGTLPVRELWLLRHPRDRRAARLDAVAEWIIACCRDADEGARIKASG